MKAIFCNYIRFLKGLASGKFVLGFIGGVGFAVTMAYTAIVIIGDNPVLMGQVVKLVLSLMAQ